MPLSLFPTRSAIGVVKADNGKQYSVFMTVEFARALSDLFTRVGGDEGIGVDEITSYLADLSSRPTPAEPEQFQMPAPELSQLMAEMQVLRQEVADLKQQIAQAKTDIMSVSDLEQFIINPAQPIDWERPGQIGFATPNSGSFTKLRVAAGTVALPSFYMTTETSTGFYRVGANNWGFAVSGARAWEVTAAGHFGIGVTPITRLDVAQTGGSRIRWDISGGTVNSTASNASGAAYAPHQHNAATHVWTLNGATPKLQIDGAGLVLVNLGASVGGEQFQCNGTAKIYGDLSSNGAFGCNGKAAQTSVALGFAAGDLPTVITLANNMRAALIANGIGA